MRRRPRVSRPALLAAVLLGCVLAASASASALATPHTTTSLRLPVVSAEVSSTTSYVVVPMGHLDDPVNTFWQLFTAKGTTTHWQLATPPGVADNGGLFLATNGSRELVGFGTSQDLGFSPIAITADSGTSWNPATLPSPLLRAPDVLAGDGSTGIALVDDGGPVVLSSSDGLSSWRRLLDTSALARTIAGEVCRVGQLTGVAQSSNGPVVATTCGTAGKVGLFGLRDGSWHLLGPALPAPMTGLHVEVVRLVASGSELSMLLALSGTSGSALLAATSSNGGDSWSLSARQSLSSGASLVATATARGGGFAVLTSSGGTARTLDLLASARSAWSSVTAPNGAAAVAVEASSGVFSFLTDGSALHVWRLGSNKTWSEIGTLQVPIPYGSSG